MNDLRYALRSLSKQPGFTAVAVLTLALGIGANTAVFSVVYGVLLRALPYPESERLVRLYEGGEGERGTVSPPDFVDWRGQATSFEAMVAFHGDRVTLTGAGEAEELPAASVTFGFFTVLGVSPAFGRDFAREEEVPGPDHVAVVSHGLWQRRFGADPADSAMRQSFRHPARSSTSWS